MNDESTGIGPEASSWPDATEKYAKNPNCKDMEKIWFYISYYQTVNWMFKMKWRSAYGAEIKFWVF